MSMAATMYPAEIPITMRNNWPPNRYISAALPRTRIADMKDMNIEAVTGNRDSSLSATRYSLENNARVN